MSKVAAGPARWLWFACGWVAVGLGGLGIIVPGLPTTVFFIVAASCFARSSPRFEQWVLNLPKIGPLVRDYRAGLGMPRRAKRYSIGSLWFFAGGSAALTASGAPVVAGVIVLAGLVGHWYIARRVPTREDVLAQRSGPPPVGRSTALS
jgi:uncharacterized membrane protein YbaN (DUF454 family)